MAGLAAMLTEYTVYVITYVISSMLYHLYYNICYIIYIITYVILSLIYCFRYIPYYRIYHNHDITASLSHLLLLILPFGPDTAVIRLFSIIVYFLFL